MTSTYVRRSGDSMLALHQQTLVESDGKSVPDHLGSVAKSAQRRRAAGTQVALDPIMCN